jgi:hypothetical protein
LYQGGQYFEQLDDDERDWLIAEIKTLKRQDWVLKLLKMKMMEIC